jgi:hypothetical protein
MGLGLSVVALAWAQERPYGKVTREGNDDIYF